MLPFTKAKCQVGKNPAKRSMWQLWLVSLARSRHMFFVGEERRVCFCSSSCFSVVRHVTGPAAPSAAAQPPAGLREAEFLPLVARLCWTPRPTPLLLFELLLLLRLLHLLPDDSPLKEKKKSCPWLFCSALQFNRVCFNQIKPLEYGKFWSSTCVESRINQCAGLWQCCLETALNIFTKQDARPGLVYAAHERSLVSGLNCYARKPLCASWWPSWYRRDVVVPTKRPWGQHRALSLKVWVRLVPSGSSLSNGFRPGTQLVQRNCCKSGYRCRCLILQNLPELKFNKGRCTKNLTFNYFFLSQNPLPFHTLTQIILYQASSVQMCRNPRSVKLQHV